MSLDQGLSYSKGGHPLFCLLKRRKVELRAYPNTPAARNASRPQATGRNARSFSGGLPQRSSRRQNRCLHAGARSTTPHRALTPAPRLLACAASPRGRTVPSSRPRSGSPPPRPKHRPLQTPPLPVVLAWRRALDHQASDGWAPSLPGMPMAPLHDQAHRHSLPFPHQTPLDAGGGVSRWDAARVVLPPSGALVSAPSRANHSHSLPCASSPSSPSACQRVRKTRLPPRLERDQARSNGHTALIAPTSASGSRFARRRKARRHRADLGCAVVLHRSGGS